MVVLIVWVIKLIQIFPVFLLPQMSMSEFRLAKLTYVFERFFGE